jgi:hypothetical protein
MSIISGRLHPVDVKINISVERRSPSPSGRTFKARKELESITLYLAMKHLGALDIHTKINIVPGQGNVGYSTITGYLRKRSFPHSSEPVEEEAKSGVAIQLTVLFCKPSMNNLLRHFDNLPRGH